MIGTIEAGYGDCEEQTIRPADAFELARSAARVAVRIYRTLLPNVFQTVVDHAVQIWGAKHASLYFDRPGTDDRTTDATFAYQVSSGPLSRKYLASHPPRPAGLGQRAIAERRAIFVPDPSKGEDELAFQRANPELYEQGIRAMAAIPLVVKPMRQAHATRDEEPVAGTDQGILYVGFGDEPGERSDKVHRFTPEEIGWLQLFANSATDAIRHAMAYAQMRDHARLLSNLHSVAESLVSIPEDPDLLRHIAWNVLNVLGADVVTIYQYVQSENRFITPPAIAGRLLDPRTMRAKVMPGDSPALLLRNPRGPLPLYVTSSRDNDLLNPTGSKGNRKSFVLREHIESTAFIPLMTGKAIGQEIVGVLFVNYRRRHAFSVDERKIIETLATTAAVAIKNGRLLKIFRDTDHTMLVTQDVEKVLSRIVRRAVNHTRAEFGEIRLFNPLRQRLEVRRRYPVRDRGADRDEDLAARREAENEVMKTCECVLVHEYRRDHRCHAFGGKQTSSELCVPLRRDGQCLGVLRVVGRGPDAFHVRQQAVLLALADRVVLALQIDESQKRLKTNQMLSTLGGLTGTLLHRLKNDLLGISCFFDSMKKARDDGDVALALKHAGQVGTLSELFLEQVTRLRDWSKAKSERVDLSDAVRRGLELVSIPPERPCRV